MAIRRVKLVWSAAREPLPGPWRYGLWTVYDRDPGSRIKHLAVSVRGLLLWLSGGAVAGYLLGAVVLFAWFQRSPYNLVGFGDTVLMPLRWAHVRELRGRAMIAEGMADMKAQRWGDASVKLRVGLARAPHDWRARLQLTQFYVAINRRAEALKILTEDLAWGYPSRPYLTTLFSVANEGEDYDIVIATCDRYLAATHPDRTWLVTEKIKAQTASGRAADALAVLDTDPDRNLWQLREARVMALLGLGRANDAVKFLEDWDREQPSSHDQVIRLKVRALREAHRLAEMDAALDEFRRLSADEPRVYVYGVVQRSLAGETAAASAGLEDYLLRFSGDINNLALVTGALVDARAASLVDRCVKEAADHGFPAKPFLVWQLQVQLATGDWSGAVRSVAALQPLMKNAPAQELFAFEWMQRVAAATAQQTDEPATALLAFLAKRPLPMRVYRMTAEALILAKRWSAAQRVLQLANGLYPSSPALGALESKAAAALQARVAPKAEFAAVPAPAALTVEKQFFQKLEADEQAGRWTEAASAISEVRVSKPDWLGRRESEVLEAQMRIAMHTGEMLDVIGAAKVYLDGGSAHALFVFNLAKELGLRGARDDGEALLIELLRKTPHYPPAERLLKEWHPPEKKRTK